MNGDFSCFGERVYNAIKELIDKTPEEKREYAEKKMIETLFEYNILENKLVIIPITAENNALVGWCITPEKEISLTEFGEEVYKVLLNKTYR